MSFNNDTESYICLSKSFSFSNNVFLKHVVSQNHSLTRWLAVISGCNPDLKSWLAITSDSNSVFKNEEYTSPKRRYFLLPGVVHLGMDYFISMFLRNDVRFSASFLVHEEKSSFYCQYFPFYDFSEKYLCKTWWYHDFLKIKQTWNFV